MKLLIAFVTILVSSDIAYCDSTALPNTEDCIKKSMLYPERDRQNYQNLCFVQIQRFCELNSTKYADCIYNKALDIDGNARKLLEKLPDNPSSIEIPKVLYKRNLDRLRNESIEEHCESIRGLLSEECFLISSFSRLVGAYWLRNK